jgi:hypothetical protein
MTLLNEAAVNALKAMLPERLSRWLPQLIAAELIFDVPVPLMAAIIDRESLGGDALRPKGPSGYGDRGHGHGLGQIDDRSHGGFLGARFWDGVRLWAEPTFNILYAARLMRSNLTASRGDFHLSIAAYNCGLTKARWELEKQHGAITDEESRIAVLDSATAGGNYVSDVLSRWKKFTPPEAGYA